MRVLRAASPLLDLDLTLQKQRKQHLSPVLSASLKGALFGQNCNHHR